MPLSKAEFDEACLTICPHCRSGALPRQRKDTQEWVHDLGAKGTVQHTICWASGLRTSRFAEDAGG